MLKSCSVYISKMSDLSDNTNENVDTRRKLPDLSDNTNQNVDTRPISKRKRKSTIDPYYVYYSPTLKRRPLSVTQPSASKLNSRLKRKNLNSLSSVNSTFTKKLKRYEIKADCSKSFENVKSTDQSDTQSKIQPETSEIAAKELTLTGCMPKINNTTAEVEPRKFNALKRCSSKQRKTVRCEYVYTSTFIDGRIKITKKHIQPKMDQNKSQDIKESLTRHVETQTIDVVENAAQVIPNVTDTGVQTDLQTRNELCDFTQTIDVAQNEAQAIPNVTDAGVQTDLQTRNDLGDFTQTIDVAENEAQVIPNVTDAGVQTDLQTRNELCDFTQTIDVVQNEAQVIPNVTDAGVQTDLQTRNDLGDFTQTIDVAENEAQVIPNVTDASVQTQTIDVVDNEAQVVPIVSDTGVQTDLQTRNELCDFSCQTMFPDAMSESLSSVTELRRRISELEQDLAKSKKTSPEITAVYQPIQCTVNSTIQRQKPLSSLLGTTIDLINSQQPPASVTTDSVSNSCIPYQLPRITAVYASTPRRAVEEEDTFSSTCQSTHQRYFHLQQAHPSQSSVVNTQNEASVTTNSFIPHQLPRITAVYASTPRRAVEEDKFPSPCHSSHQQYFQQQQSHPSQSSQQLNCACRQCFQNRQPPLLNNVSESISIPSEQSVQHQPLHHKQLSEQGFTQQTQLQPMDKHQQRMQLLQEELHQQQSRQQELFQRHRLRQQIDEERLKRFYLEMKL